MGLFDWTLNRMAGAAMDNSVIVLQAKTPGGLTSEIQKYARKGYAMQGGITTNSEYGHPVYYATMIHIESSATQGEQLEPEPNLKMSEQEKLDYELEKKRKELQELESKQAKLKELEELDKKIETKKRVAMSQSNVKDRDDSAKNQSISQEIKQAIKNELGIDKQKSNLKKSLHRFIDKL